MKVWAFVVGAGLAAAASVPLTMAQDVPTTAAPAQAEGDLSVKELAAMAARLAPSFVIVEWTAQYDKGEAPGNAFSNWRGGGRGDAGAGRQVESWDQLIRDERPAERSGIVLSPTIVLSGDPMLHPRFLRSIVVREGDRRIAARVAGYAENNGGLYLELAEPLKDARPVTFDPNAAEPYFGALHAPREDGWLLGVSGAPSRVTIASGRREFTPASLEMLIVDRAGAGVGVTMNGELTVDGSWKGSPIQWSRVSAAEFADALKAVEARASDVLPRVAITLRSPRTRGDARAQAWSGRQDDADATSTEWNGSGVLLNDRTVLVLANLQPKVTARLETITVVMGDGVERQADFAGTLRDFGALLATLREPLPAGRTGVDAATLQPITTYRDRLVVRAEVEVQGESRTAFFMQERMSAFEQGWRRKLMPLVPPSREGFGGFGRRDGRSQNFVFTRAGDLIAIPIARRQRLAAQDRSWDAPGVTVMPIAYVLEAITQGKPALDNDNVPLSEEQENRLAWLGVEMQPMDEELARVNGVSSQTRNGETGTLVSFVYPDSPAAKAGIEVGDILLRLHIDGQPRPLEVRMPADPYAGMMAEYFARLDEVPEEYFDQLPAPWGSAENVLTRALTDVGFGTKFTADVFRGGTVLEKPFVVEAGPAHFQSARRVKSEDGGLTVRDLTFEVRRFFQMAPTDPGVVISRIERGGKAAVAGLRPYEIITSVNDRSIASAADFADAIKGGGELRVSVKRMAEGRIVKLRLDPENLGVGGPQP